MLGTAGAVRILVVSPREEAPGEVRGALSPRYADAQIYWVSQEALAAARAEDLRPDVVLVYADVGTDACVALVRGLVQRLPEVATFVVVPWDGTSTARLAVLAGARGFVMQPIEAEDLNRALTGVLGGGATTVRPPPALAAEGAGALIVFCAPKGGTGRTTLVVNTALSLRGVTGERVLLIDADFSAAAIDVALNLKHLHDMGDLLPRIAEMDEALMESVLVEHQSGVRALLAPPAVQGGAPVAALQMQQILRVARRMSEWVVVDLGLPLDDTAYACLLAADRIVVNVLPETIGLRNTRQMLERMRAHGVPQDKIRVVINRATMPGAVPLADIRERYGLDVSYQVPDDQATATASVNRGVPLVIDRQHTKLARSMRQFATCLVNDVRGTPGEAPAFGPAEELPRQRRVSPLVWVLSSAITVVAAGMLLAPRLVEAFPPRQAVAVAPSPTAAQVALAVGSTDAPGATAASPTPEALATRTEIPPSTAAATGLAAIPTAASGASTASGETVLPLPSASPEATAAPTATPQPSPASTATATVTPLPTATATEQPTATPTATLAPTATATLAPTATATATPEPTARPVATPTVTLRPIYASGWYPPPLPISPENRAVFGADDRVVLRWAPSGELRSGVYYVVTLAYSYRGRTVYDSVPWVTTTEWDATEHDYLREVAERGQFYWSLTLMRQTGLDAEGKPVGAAISPMSEVRNFTWLSTPTD